MLEVRGMDKLTTALNEISDERHHQYSLGYYPENQNWDGAITPILSIRQCGRKTPLGFSALCSVLFYPCVGKRGT